MTDEQAERPRSRRIVDVVTRAVYVLVAGFYLLLGTVVLLLGTGVLPGWVRDRIFEMGRNDPFTMHLIQETGTLWVLVGILLLWFARHYDLSMKFHWAMTFSFLLEHGEGNDQAGAKYSSVVYWYQREHEPEYWALDMFEEKSN